MKATLRPGLSRVGRIVVDRDRSIGFMGEEGRVYGTPALVLDIEHTSRDLLLEHADPGEDSVGMEIAVRHTAPTLLGMGVKITVTVTAIDGRKISLAIAAEDDVEPIATGTHTRFIVDVKKTHERLKTKAARRSALVG